MVLGSDLALSSRSFQIQDRLAVRDNTLTEVQALLDAGKFHEAEGALRTYLVD